MAGHQNTPAVIVRHPPRETNSPSALNLSRSTNAIIKEQVDLIPKIHGGKGKLANPSWNFSREGEIKHNTDTCCFVSLSLFL